MFLTCTYFQGRTRSSSVCVLHTCRRFSFTPVPVSMFLWGRRPKYNNLLVYFYMVLSLKFKILVSPSVGHRYMYCGLKPPLQDTPLLMCHVSAQVTRTLNAKHQVSTESILWLMRTVLLLDSLCEGLLYKLVPNLANITCELWRRRRRTNLHFPKAHRLPKLLYFSYIFHYWGQRLDNRQLKWGEAYFGSQLRGCNP